MVRYIVQPGDTIAKIAAKYATTINAIVRANGIRNPDWIQVGQMLKIPTKMYYDNNNYYNNNGGYNNDGGYKHGGGYKKDTYHMKKLYHKYDD